MELDNVTNLKDMLDFACEKYGEVHFIEYKEDGIVKSKTYNEFRRASQAFSRMLHEMFYDECHVALLGTTSFEWISAFFGTVNCGFQAVPLAPNETTEMLSKLIEFADVNVLCYKGIRDDLYNLVKSKNSRVKYFISLDNSSTHDDVINISDILSRFDGEFDYNPDPDSVAAICFTSGTTGFPKGVMTTHKNYVYTATSVHAFLPTKRMLTVLPIHHSFCFSGNILKSIVNGRTVCVNDDFQNLISDFRLYKPDDIMAVPAIIKKFMMAAISNAKAHPELDYQKAVNDFLGGNMVEIISGGAPLDPELNALFNETGIKVLNGYGMTECSPIIANNSQAFHRHGSVGRPIPCMDLKFENGEILVKGPSVMKGYYKNPDATAEAFTEDGYLKTGDVGYMDDDGYLYITGRCKNLILLDNGENVSAEMLEAKFENESLVQECICYNEGSAICVEAYLNKDFIFANNFTSTQQAMLDVLERVNSKLATFQRIGAFVIRDIPFEKTASGKIKRNSKLGLKGAKRTTVKPVTDSEKMVCNAVKSQLSLAQISVTDNFFALGGDSLSAMELAVTLNINAQLIYDNPFLRALAAAIDKEKDGFSDKVEGINDIIRQTAHGETAEEYKSALLTGATGFLGVHILSELLDRGVKTYCIVRSKDRFYNNWKHYFADKDCSCVKLIIGNIEKENLGLPFAEYKKLCEETDVVFHVAANVHHAGDYSDLKRTNVDGTKNIIQFCKKSGAVLQHTSTVSLHGAATVKQRYEKSVFDEDILDISQHYSDNVYIHSKYIAEQEVLLARLDGVRTNIYRIGNLTWRSSDGMFQKNAADNGFLHRIHAILKLGLVNENMDKYPTDLTPVDECAKGFVNLALTGKTNEIYHMFNPNYLDTEDMFKRLGLQYKVVSTQETIETIFANKNDRDIHVYLFYLIISAKSKNIEMLAEKTCAELLKTGFVWSKPTKDYLTVSNSSLYPNGWMLNFEPIELNPMRKTGGKINPIQALTLGNMKDACIHESTVFKGDDSLALLGDKMLDDGVKKPLVLTFEYAFENNHVQNLLSRFSSSTVFTDIQSDPGLKQNDELLALYNEENCDSILAIGGGSVIDTAKILSLRAANPGEIIDDITRMDSDCNNGVPFYCVPTTAGTGSEVTVFAVMTDESENKKKPFVSDKYLPSVIALDPSLTLSVPKMSTAFTGIDALSHAIEAYTSMFAQSFPADRDKALSASKRIFDNLKRVAENGADYQARAELQLAALESGIAFRRISTCYVHAIAHRIGEFYHVPHGKAIAAYLVKIMKASMPYNAPALAEMSRYCCISDFCDNEKDAMAFIQATENLIADVGITFDDITIKDEDKRSIMLRAQEEAKLTGYPRPFSDEEVFSLL